MSLVDLTKPVMYSETAWLTTGLSEVVADGTSINILTLFDNVADKQAISDRYDQLDITTDKIITTYTGSKTLHTIRLIFDISVGNLQFYQIELRRKSDDSVISVHGMNRNPDQPTQTINIVTRTLSPTDPFVIGGFYLAFVNQSGLSCTVSGNMQLVIISQRQIG